MNIAVVGATGMVGTQILKVLAEFSFPITNLLLVASERSIGKEIEFGGSKHAIISMEEAISRKPHIAIFSAGGDTSRAFAQQFADAGTTVIDNSSAFRMDADKKLIVPEINANQLTASDKIIANPNCSTIQMVLALSEIHKNYGIKRLVISTYQSITGTGVKAVRQMENERNNEKGEMAYPYRIDKNCLPHGGDFQEDGYTTEEQKLVDETHKIFSDDTIGITATVVRVPVVGGHSESLNVECNKPFEVSEIRQMIANTPGCVLQDNPEMNIYPMPKYTEGKNEVFVGRVRRDLSVENGLNMWVVADNLRKGAATNAVQIAEYLMKEGLV
ncbi:MAG: aspartate-semialdehyde dehydrogenase [Flavobacteriales bacterium]